MLLQGSQSEISVDVPLPDQPLVVSDGSISYDLYSFEVTHLVHSVSYVFKVAAVTSTGAHGPLRYVVWACVGRCPAFCVCVHVSVWCVCLYVCAYVCCM